jgi:putative DNA primase/helicase
MMAPSTSAGLDAGHWHKLAVERGIAPEVITERGYFSASQPADLRDLHFTKVQAKAAPALVIPRWNVQGQPDGCQMRPDHPRQFADGKVAKYELPTGSHVILDVHPRMQPLLGNPQEPLWITEGIPKADALVSQSACAIALSGVWGFRGSNEHKGRVILPDWDHVALNGRTVYVVFDSDIYHKPDVEKALKALYTFLRTRGAIPRLVQWPEEYRQQKWGVDDYLAQGYTLQDLLAMVPPQGPLSHTPPHGTSHGITFAMNERGNHPRPALLNILYVLEQDQTWHGALGFNALLNDVVLLQRPPYLRTEGPWMPRAVTEQDWAETANWLQRTYQLYVSSAMAGEGLTTYGCRFPFHPIYDYLSSLAWDGTPRLDTFLHVYCHVVDTLYSRAVSSKTLIAAVARIMEPGCKVDTMTIMEGDQGLGKSEAWRTLVSDEWFIDGLPDLHDKDAAQTLCGKWFVELAELSQFQRSEIETVKAFLSRPSDHYRPSYGRRAATFPRQQVFVGTTNAEHYFKDRTGNRRYWPVTVEAACDLAAIGRDRDQLWAEAVVRYQAGERWYMTEAQETLAREEQAIRLEPDDWEEPVLAYAAGKDRVTTKEIMVEQFHWDNPALWTQANTKRVGAILRQAGWTSKPYRDEHGTLVKGYENRQHGPQPVTGVTGSTGDITPTGNNVSTSKNNDVTGVTGVTGCIHTHTEHSENVVNVEMHEIRVLQSLPEKPGNTGNTGNSAGHYVHNVNGINDIVDPAIVTGSSPVTGPLTPMPANDCSPPPCPHTETKKILMEDGSTWERCQGLGCRWSRIIPPKERKT